MATINARKHPLLKFKIEITKQCNLRCVYCFLENRQGMLEKDIIFKIIDEAATLDTFTISISGGEPFLRKELFEIIEKARKEHFSVMVLTNGTLITDDVANRLSELNLFRVVISLYGASESTYEKFTGERAFHKVMQGIEYLAKRGVHTILKFNLNTITIKDLQRVREEIGKLPKVGIYFSCLISPRKNGDFGVTKYTLQASELRQIAENLNLNILGLPSENLHLNTIYTHSGLPCGGGMTNCHITADGKVLPCSIFPIEAGNIYQSSLKEIWEESPVFVKLRNLKIDDFEKCSSCKYLYTCGRCPAVSYLENHDYLKVSKYVCDFTHEYYGAR